MENEKKSNGTLVGILIGVIIMLLVGIGLFATGTIGFKTNTTVENGQTSGDTDKNIETTTNEDEADISREVMDKFFTEVFYYHKSPYCGEGTYDLNEGESLSYYTADNGETYLPSKQYKNKNEIIEYFKSYLSDNMIKKIVNEKDYLDKDSKLYCRVIRAGSLSYIKEKSSFKASESTENKIVGIGTVAYDATGSEMTLTCKYVLIKENSNWVLDKYEEEL